MNIITRTVYGSALQTARLFDLEYTLVENTTLNEKFDIEAGTTLDGETPSVGYICIGNNGHQVITGGDGLAFTTPINHRSKDAACYNHIPFVLREEDDDLTITERARYALRRREVINGVNYIAYYLKRLDFADVALNMEYTQVIDGNESTRPFVPSQDALNPQKPNVSNEGIITTDGTFLSASAILPIAFDEKDVQELVDVARVLYDNEQRAIISEIGIASGVDRTVTTNGTSGQFDYKEVIGVQIASHVTGYWPVGQSNQGFTINIQGGATEPMLGEKVRQG